MMAEADGDDIEERYVTACFVLMSEFKWNIETMKSCPATTFHILLEELNKKTQRENEAYKSNKRFR